MKTDFTYIAKNKGKKGWPGVFIAGSFDCPRHVLIL
jgi:hypothetical protein